MRLLKLVVLAALCWQLLPSAFAKIWMPSIFSDNMMLQRGAFVRIWGEALPGAKVVVSFGDQRKSAQADANGKWSLSLDKMPASKEPREMVVYENKKEGKRIRNVLVGEVWILAGQSNMQWSAYNTTDFEKLAERAGKYSNMRYFDQRTKTLSLKPARDSNGGAWFAVNSRKSAGACSAVGIYFGERLMKDLDVPVGLVFTALGASKMSAWIPEESVSKLKYLESEWEKFWEEMRAYDYRKAHAEWKVKSAAWDAEAAKAKAEKRKPVPEYRPFEPVELSSRMPAQTPVYLYNGVIAPLAGFTVRGVLWYQGESDSYGESLDNFCGQFELLVASWREKFMNPNMPFIWAQLTSLDRQSGWPMTRWRQLQSAKSVKPGAVVNLIDLGEKNDVHPRDKASVGQRFENVALRMVYGEDKVPAYAPEMSSVSYSGNSASVKFNTYGSGLVGKGDPRGFEVLSGGKWLPAKAALNGDSVSVSHQGGGKIDGVRYLWKSWARPDVWLYNKDGIPAFSFIDEKNKK